MAERHPDLKPGESMVKLERLVRESTVTVRSTTEDGSQWKMIMPIEQVLQLFDYGESVVYAVGSLGDGIFHMRGKLSPDTVPYPTW